VATEDLADAAVWSSWEAADLVKDALAHSQGLAVEIVEGCA
jgi:hypothetical protein